MATRRTWLSALGALFLLAASAPVAAETALERNKALVRRVFDEMLNQGKMELFDQAYTRDFVKHVDTKSYSLAEEIEQATRTRAMSSDLVMTIDRMIAEGDLVAVVYTGRGTSTGPFAGMPPTGKFGVVTGASVFRVADGKIAEEWTFYNPLEIMKQMGYGAPATALTTATPHE